PLGGLFFGMLGDKYGRQKILAITIVADCCDAAAFVSDVFAAPALVAAALFDCRRCRAVLSRFTDTVPVIGLVPALMNSIVVLR
ncbi:hypothetical protein O5833_28590, partial [Escherichia coli]|nr:hypothetical protein [Escherichia coli]